MRVSCTSSFVSTCQPPHERAICDDDSVAVPPSQATPWSLSRLASTCSMEGSIRVARRPCLCCRKGLAPRPKGLLHSHHHTLPNHSSHTHRHRDAVMAVASATAAAAAWRHQLQISTLLVLLTMLLLVTIAPAFLLPTPSISSTMTTTRMSNGQSQGDFDAPESDDGTNPPPAPSDMLARIMQVTYGAQCISFPMVTVLLSLPPSYPRSFARRLLSFLCLSFVTTRELNNDVHLRAKAATGLCIPRRCEVHIA